MADAQDHMECPECMDLLADYVDCSLPRDQAQGLVPEHVFHTQQQFHQCPRCRGLSGLLLHLVAGPAGDEGRGESQGDEGHAQGYRQ